MACARWQLRVYASFHPSVSAKSASEKHPDVFFKNASFLFAFYFPSAASERAVAKMESLQNPALIFVARSVRVPAGRWFKVGLYAQAQPERNFRAICAGSIRAS
jgi:hypothetical protein